MGAYRVQQFDAARPDSPAVELMTRLTRAFDLFNDELFGGCLPQVMLQLRNKPGTWGYFQLNKWETPDGQLLDVINLDSGTANTRPLIQLCSTLVHEMAHAYVCNFVCYRDSTGGHRKEWRAEMDRLGLPPVKGGCTWRTATHRIDPDGLFSRAFARHEQELQSLPWQELIRAGRGGVRGPDRVKFHCPECGTSFQARPTLQALCGQCSTTTRLVPFVCSAGKASAGGSGSGLDDNPPSKAPGLPVWTDELSRELRTHTGLEEPPTSTAEALMVLSAGMDEHKDLLQNLLDAIPEKGDSYDSALKAVYRVRARRLHPDVAGGSEISFKALQIAYRILCPPERKT
jgi:ribosomal protein S27AE